MADQTDGMDEEEREVRREGEEEREGKGERGGGGERGGDYSRHVTLVTGFQVSSHA